MRAQSAAAVAAFLIWTGGVSQAQTLIHRIDGTAAGDQAGYAVSGGLDATGDGVPDVLVGLPFSDAKAVNGGAARLYSGVSGELVYELANPQDAAHFGKAVALLEDLDGDGYAEVLVGAPEYNVTGSDCGRAYLYSGKNGDPIANFSGS